MVSLDDLRETKYKGYFVDVVGNVYSIIDNKGRYRYDQQPHKLKPNKNSAGYYQVYISYSGNMQAVMIHTLMAYTFIGKRPNGYHIDHIDGNKENNRIENLQYLSATENIRKGNIGKIAPNRIFVKSIVDGEPYEFCSVKKFCEFFGLKKLQISTLINKGIKKQNNASKYFFRSIKKTQTTIEIEMSKNLNWTGLRK